MQESLESKATSCSPPNSQTGIATRPAAARALVGVGIEDDDEDKIRLRDYWQSIRKRMWSIVGVSLLVTTLTAVYMARMPDIFQAQALVQVDLEDVNPALNGTGRNSPVIVNSQMNDPAYFNTQLRILTSPGLLRRVVKTLDLDRNENFKSAGAGNRRSVLENLKRMVGFGAKERAKGPADDQLPLTTVVATATAQTDLDEAERYEPYIKYLVEDLQVEPVVEKRMGFGRDNTRLIEIRYKHADPRIAAKVVNAVADVLSVSNLERKAEKTVSTGQFLQKRIAELLAQIRGGEERLLDYSKSKEILSLDASQNTVVERLIGLNRQLLEAENDRKLAEVSYQAALEPGAADALADENASRLTTDIKTKLAELWQRRAQLMVENTEEWPEVKEITQQIGALEKEIEQTRDRSTSTLLTNLKTRYQQTLAREHAVKTAFNQQRGETLSQNEAAVNYRILQQEIETNKNLLNGLLQNYKENDVVLAGVYNNVHIIDYAVAPDKPTGPNRLQGVALALFLSIPAGIGLALLLEHINDTIRSIDDVERKLRLPALAAIPVAKAKALPRPGNQPAIPTGQDARSPTSEAYRQLRTAVLLSTPGRAPKTILITSCVPAEGKTTSSINLASSLAQTKAKVLIIDADLRRPRLRSIFGLNGARGLSSFLSSEMGEDELLTMIQRHESSDLHVLTSGPVPPNPAELLGSGRMRELIGILESHFTHIIIDSAPIASFTDAVLVSSMVDGVLMVVYCNRTPRELLHRCRQMLLAGGANIIGVILNHVEAHASNYYYQGYYQQTDAERQAESGQSQAAAHEASGAGAPRSGELISGPGPGGRKRSRAREAAPTIVEADPNGRAAAGRAAAAAAGVGGYPDAPLPQSSETQIIPISPQVQILSAGGAPREAMEVSAVVEVVERQEYDPKELLQLYKLLLIIKLLDKV